jgi:hypothetical protein
MHSRSKGHHLKKAYFNNYLFLVEIVFWNTDSLFPSGKVVKMLGFRLLSLKPCASLLCVFCRTRLLHRDRNRSPKAGLFRPFRSLGCGCYRLPALPRSSADSFLHTRISTNTLTALDYTSLRISASRGPPERLHLYRRSRNRS